MRRVYSPLPGQSDWWGPLLGACLITLAVFLVLPLTQMVSSGIQKKLYLSKVSAVELEPPRDQETAPPPPPPPETPEETPPPSLSDAPRPLNLSVDLDVAVGSGGALAAGFASAEAAGAGEALDTFDVADLERRPEVIASVAPVYPAELRKARVEGSVNLLFVLDEEGRVQDARVDSSTRTEFETPALEAIRKWRFKPGMKDGQAVRTFLKLPIRFRSAP